MMAASLRGDLLAFAEGRRARFEELLRTFVECPSVSADPDRQGDIRRMADLAAATVRELGGKAEVQHTRGNPVVHGTFGEDPGLPTVIFYNHLDVQPASRAEEPWETEPFQLIRRGDRYFGRGATDDKGPALTALLGAVASREAAVPANVRLLWELEEEIGSPHFDEGVARLEDVGADSVVVSDTAWLARDRPASEAGFRGFQGFRLTLETAGSDRHSGDVGGAARNAVAELAALVAEMHDARTGRVTIPGFHDDVREPTPAELEEFRRSGFSLEEFRRVHELRSLRTDDPLEVMRRTWALPTFEVHGITGGYAGPGLKAIVPGRAEAKVSCRLVPDQRPRRIRDLVRAFVRERSPDVTVEPAGSALPYRGVTTGPHADALRTAMHFGFGAEPAFVRSGGTIGAVTALAERLRCPILFLGLSLPEHGYHAPNENYDWGQARGGILAFVRYLEAVSKMRAARSSPAGR